MSFETMNILSETVDMYLYLYISQKYFLSYLDHVIRKKWWSTIKIESNTYTTTDMSKKVEGWVA